MSYTKFIILGEERTGSNFLQILLASHSNIVSFGELFNRKEEIREKSLKIAKQLVLGDAPITFDDNPVEYLQNHVYKEYPNNIKAVGFRLFYAHARNNEWNDVWDYLRSADIKIIHLKRKNLLDRYLSNKLAERSNIWISAKEGNGTYNNPIKLNPLEYINDFHKSVWYQKEADAFFKDNLKINVIYEDLCNDLARESKRVQDFLKLEFQELSSKTRKQRKKPKYEIIENYEDLKKQLIQGVSEGWAKKEWLNFFN